MKIFKSYSMESKRPLWLMIPLFILNIIIATLIITSLLGCDDQRNNNLLPIIELSQQKNNPAQTSLEVTGMYVIYSNGTDYQTSPDNILVSGIEPTYVYQGVTYLPYKLVISLFPEPITEIDITLNVTGTSTIIIPGVTGPVGVDLHVDIPISLISTLAGINNLFTISGKITDYRGIEYQFETPEVEFMP
jgi:hypothetical protein